MIKNEVVHKAINYILSHLDEDITIEEVANHCHFSKYYFSRIFKEETGESIYSFAKRMRLEQSAINLKLETKKSATDIGADYGYSASNYSTAFKKHHHRSPAEFRKEINPSCILHPYHKGALTQFKSFEEYDEEISIAEMEDFFVLYERHLGNYLELGDNWSSFREKYKIFQGENTLFIERFYDDPSITDVNQCLYDICMTGEKDFIENREVETDFNSASASTMTIQGGKFAVYRFIGAVNDIFTAFQGVFNTWLPRSGYEMDERYGLDIYREMDNEKKQVIVDLCIPIK